MVKKSSKKSNKNHSKKNIEKTSNNFSSKFNFLTENSDLIKKVIPLIFILIVMFVAFQVRSGPIDLNGLNKNIESNTYAQIQNLISQNVNTKYPNLADSYKQELVQKEYKKVLDSGVFEIGGQKLIVSDAIKANANTIKASFKAPNGQTYLTAIDPYLWLRSSDNYFKNGYTGNKIVDSVKKDTLRLAPGGFLATTTPDFHIWLESKLFSFNNLNKNSTIGEKTNAVYLIPVIFVMLSVIPIFLIIRRFSNDISALFGSLLLVSIGTFVSRTVAGFVDTDAYNVFFPLVIVAFLIYGFIFRNIYLTILFGILAGLVQAIFIWAWGYGWFIYIFTLFALLAYLGYILILSFLNKMNLKEFKFSIQNDFNLILSFILSSYLFNFLINGSNIFSLSFNSVLNSLGGLAAVSKTNIWPNVLSSVAELNSASFISIINSIGGPIVFLIALFGLLFLFLDFKPKINKHDLYKRILVIFSIIWFISIVKYNFLISLTANHIFIFLVLLFLPIGFAIFLNLLNKVNSNKIFLGILLSIWMCGTIFMSLNGVRFILLLAPAFAISFGIGIFYIFKIVNDFFTKEFKIKTNLKQQLGGFIVVLILFFTLYSPMYTQAQAISDGTVPNFDDAWYSSMYKIKNNSQDSAIITSWWDFGHFFATIAQRGVTFDGGSQTVPASHWVGKLLLENNEDKSRDILRMLVCGNNAAFDTMLNYSSGSNVDAVKINKILYSTFGKNISKTKKVLENNKYYTYNSKQVDMIMSYLACENPSENFLITSGDMVGKAGVWAHWGSWDFTKKYVRDNYNLESAQIIANKLDENISLINKYISQLNTLKNKSATQNIKLDNLINQWLAPYPSYVPIQGKYSYPCVSSNSTLICQNGVKIDMLNGKILTNFNGQIKFKNLVYPNRLKQLSIIEQNKDGNMDALLIPAGNGKFNIMISQSPLGASLFTKLFYLDGFGTKYFKIFDSQRSATGVKIKVWKVNWSENISNNLNTITPSLKVGDISFTANSSQVKKIIGNQTNITLNNNNNNNIVSNLSNNSINNSN